MRRVHVYKLPDRVLVCPLSTTDTGLLVASDPHFVIPSDASQEALGKFVIDALAVAGKTIPHPTDWKALSTIRLQAAGVKSEVVFQRRARLVTVEADNESLAIEPSHNGGTKGDTKGFYGKSENRFHIPRPAPPNELGAWIHAAFLQCTK
jgi:hypothetical protein